MREAPTGGFDEGDYVERNFELKRTIDLHTNQLAWTCPSDEI
jgi:hypothetical protein